ncbi:MAG: hypothetical protein RBS07_09195 [Lentimicrobium sp.]|nr:hypothetical protein [Lentimicrobium sp.]
MVDDLLLSGIIKWPSQIIKPRKGDIPPFQGSDVKVILHSDGLRPLLMLLMYSAPSGLRREGYPPFRWTAPIVNVSRPFRAQA